MSGRLKDGRFDLTATKCSYWLRYQCDDWKQAMQLAKERLAFNKISFEDHGNYLRITADQDTIYHTIVPGSPGVPR